ncbi:MAG: DNA-directed RNA polymerase subunit alpha [Patescibacteria group bacterium]
METLSLPKTFKFIEEEGNRSIFVLEPLYPEYGPTIGNTLRRVLLSSLPGAAVTAIKIKGVDHEFSTIPNVKEDVIEIILNIKQLCLKSHSAEPVKLVLKAKGDKAVNASMISKNDQVEIANPELHIATLDGKNAELEIELTVEQGRGYVPVETREGEKNEIGMIAIDSVFTPIRNVNFTVENVRVGKMTNYDKLTLYITTDGTITGREALDQAAHITVNHFQLLFRENFEREQPAQAVPDAVKLETAEKSPDAEEPEEAEGENELLSLNLSRRSYNVLNKNNIKAAKRLKALTEADLIKMQGLGAKSIKEILAAISTLK